MSLITFEKLQEATKYETPEQIRAHLDKNGIKYWIGKYNRPYTFESCYTLTLTEKSYYSSTQPVVEI